MGSVGILKLHAFLASDTDRVLIGAHIICSMTAVLSGFFLVEPHAIRGSMGRTEWFI